MRRMLKWTAVAIGLVVALVCALAINVVWFRPFDIRIFYDKAFLVYALEFPELLSSMRLLEQFGIEGHNAELNDRSPAHTERTNALLAENLETLHAYDRSSLEGQVALSYDALDWYLQTEVDGARFAYHGYPVNQQFGVQNDFPQFMASTHFIGDADDAEAYVARLSKVDGTFAGLLEDLRLRESRGIVPPRFVIDRVLVEMRAFADTPVEDNILYASLARRLEPLEDLPGDARAEILARAAREIRETVYPAYQALIAYFAALQPTVTTNHGAWKLPDGDAWYAWRLRQQTTTDLTPEQIHQMGLTEVERLEQEMDQILDAQGYTDGSVGARMTALSEEPRFRYPDTERGRQALLADYTAMVAEAEARTGELFGRLPRADIVVEPVPAFRQESAAVAFYQQPSFDGTRPGTFFVNLRDVADHPKFFMRTVTLHEAVPGHHFQSALQVELEGVAQFRRILPFAAFSEGWGLYAERLGWEAGFISDPYDNLGRLQAEIMRAARLVVDTGIHAERWPREQAIDYMIEKTGLSEGSVVSEVERYFVDPGQATAYEVGLQTFLALRERARRALGAQFDVREFHDVVLANGDLPLTILERQVDRYIAEKRS